MRDHNYWQSSDHICNILPAYLKMFSSQRPVNKDGLQNMFKGVIYNLKLWQPFALISEKTLPLPSSTLSDKNLLIAQNRFLNEM